ncbi:hypothetical protein KAH37_04985 [bacterium]|nr:hypothetical protein [bacterium]
MRFTIVVIYILLLMGTLSAAKINLRIDYRAQDVVHATRDIVKDNYWAFQIEQPPTIVDPVKYYLVLNFNTGVKMDETIYLRGFYAGPQELIIGHDSSITLKNEEDFVREFTIEDADGTTIKQMSIAPNSSVSYMFDDPGSYRVKDALYFWNVVKVMVMDETQQVYQIDKRTENITIKNVTSGSYNLKIYRGLKWIFQEDFTLVTHNEFPLSYIIKEGDVLRTNTPETPLVNIGIDGAPL